MFLGICILLVGLATMLAFQDFTGERRLLYRAPSFLELSMPLLLFAIALLPEALPGAFARILHHTITSDYVHPVDANGVQMTESWILAQWWGPLNKMFFVSVLSGMVWSLYNILRSKERKANILAFCLGIAWLTLAILGSMRLLPISW